MNLTFTKYAGTITQTETSADSWEGLENMGTGGQSVATCPMRENAGSEMVTLRNFGFCIPTEAIIRGVSVTATRRRVGSLYVLDDTLKLTKAGAESANMNSSEHWPDEPTEMVYGGESYLWGLSLTAEEVNDPAFGLLFRVGGEDLNAVAEAKIKLTVHCTL